MKKKTLKLYALLLITIIIANFWVVMPYASAATDTELLHKAYITSFNTGTVDVVDLSNNTVERAKITVGSEPNSAGFNPTGTQVYVTNRSSNNVSVIDPASDTVISTIAVGTQPHGVAFNADGSKAYIANRSSATLSVIDTVSLTVINTITVPSTPTAMIVIGQNLYVTSQSTSSVAIVDLTNETLTSSISVGDGPYGLSTNSTGTKIYVANQTGNSVSVINTADHSIEATIPAGIHTSATEVSPDGSRVYAVNASSNNVSVIDTATNSVISTIPVGSSPYVIGVAADGKHAYTVNYSSSTMSVIDTETNSVTDTIVLSNGPFMVGTFMVSTAAAANPKPLQAAMPTASLPTGAVTAGTTVSLSTTTAEATIYYSIDGSTPTTSSTVYSAPISVTNAITIQAIAVAANMADSAVMNESYTIIAPQNSMLSPATANFDKLPAAQADVTTTLTLNNNTLISIDNAATPLHLGTDYNLSSDTVTITKEYLAMQAVGTTNLTFSFSAGAMQTLAITIMDSTPSEALGAPVLQSAIAGNMQVNLTWSPVEGSTGYKVYQSVTSGTYGIELTTVQASVHTYNATDLTNGMTYFYVVKAINSAGDSTASNQASATPATLPAAPTEVAATAGNGQATLTFTPPADNGGSLITGYEVTSSAGNIIVNTTASPVTITGLQNGTTYTFTVKALNSLGSSTPSAASNAVTPVSPSSDGESTIVNTPTLVITPDTGAAVLVNGELQNIGLIAVTQINNQSVATITLDQTKLNEKLATAGQGAVITIPFNQISDIAIGELNGQIVKSLEQNRAIIKIQTPQATYTLPAQQINMDVIASHLEQNVALQDIKIQIKITTPTLERMKIVENAASAGKFTIVAPPLDFTVQATNGDTTIEVTSFNSYVERTLTLPQGVDSSKITTAIVVEADGTVRHVPTKVMVTNGVYYAKINSLTNSTYSVVFHPITFTDLTNHWAQDIVNDLGSRMVINGVNDVMFNPNQDMTRAEFAATLVRALGLKLENGVTSFKDVQSSEWYNDELLTASSYNLIQGFEDHSFRPLDKVTREQALTMIAKAITVTNLSQQLGNQSSGVTLATFTDADQVSSWASASISDSLAAGIVLGRSRNILAPKANVTRAEVAAMIYRFLYNSDLI